MKIQACFNQLSPEKWASARSPSLMSYTPQSLHNCGGYMPRVSSLYEQFWLLTETKMSKSIHPMTLF